MDVIIQPYVAKLGKRLIEDLASGKYNRFLFSVAYAKISGVDILYDHLLSFRASGGTVVASIGIDQKNTSFEALRAILSLSDNLYVFHNRSLASTFHPKVYILSGEKSGKIYVGSNNLTKGGLYTNYEAACCEEYDLTVPASAESFANIVRSFGDFWREGTCCKPATDDLIQELYDRHLLCSESEISVISRKGRVSKSKAFEEEIFGTEPITGSTKKHDFRHLAPEILIRPEYQNALDRNSETDSTGTDIDVDSDEENTNQAKCFFKHLSNNDVDLQSSPGQIIIPIQFKSFFEPLSEPQITNAGAMQSERYFNILFENTGEVTENARVIFYVPSPQAPRRNSELRFAIRNREIFKTFGKGDVLIFSKVPKSNQGQYVFSLRRIPQDSPDAGEYSKRFAWITE